METVATRCHILKLKCTKFDYSWGSTPDPSLELTALLRSLADRMPTRLKLAITCLTTSLKRHQRLFIVYYLHIEALNYCTMCLYSYSK